MSIGKNIKRLRESQGMSQIDLAAITGVTDKAVSTWESDLKIPRLKVLIQIADYFDVTLDELVGRKTSDEPERHKHTIMSERMLSTITVRKLSFRKLEHLTGIPRSALQRYATGENKIPPNRIKLLADALDVSPAWLAGWTDEN